MPDWILVVDDDPDGRDLMAELLTMSGFEAVACSTAEEAEAALDRRDRPDVIVTDLVMPSLLGTALVARLRSRPGLAGVPAIFVTGVDPSLLKDVDDPVLPKPFDFDQLLTLVGQHSRPRPPAI